MDPVWNSGFQNGRANTFSYGRPYVEKPSFDGLPIDSLEAIHTSLLAADRIAADWERVESLFETHWFGPCSCLSGVWGRRVGSGIDGASLESSSVNIPAAFDDTPRSVTPVVPQTLDRSLHDAFQRQSDLSLPPSQPHPAGNGHGAVLYGAAVAPAPAAPFTSAAAAASSAAAAENPIHLPVPVPRARGPGEADGGYLPPALPIEPSDVVVAAAVAAASVSEAVPTPPSAGAGAAAGNGCSAGAAMLLAPQLGTWADRQYRLLDPVPERGEYGPGSASASAQNSMPSSASVSNYRSQDITAALSGGVAAGGGGGSSTGTRIGGGGSGGSGALSGGGPDSGGGATSGGCGSGDYGSGAGSSSNPASNGPAPPSPTLLDILHKQHLEQQQQLQLLEGGSERVVRGGVALDSHVLAVLRQQSLSTADGNGQGQGGQGDGAQAGSHANGEGSGNRLHSHANGNAVNGAGGQHQHHHHHHHHQAIKALGAGHDKDADVGAAAPEGNPGPGADPSGQGRPPGPAPPSHPGTTASAFANMDSEEVKATAEAMIQEAAWRWRFTRRWQAEQAKTGPEHASSLPKDQMEEALAYLQATNATTTVSMQIAHAGGAAGAGHRHGHGMGSRGGASLEGSLALHSLMGTLGAATSTLGGEWPLGAFGSGSGSFTSGPRILGRQASGELLAASREVASLNRRAALVLQQQMDCEQQAERRVQESLGQGPPWVGHHIPIVQIDEWGSFRFLMLKLRDQSARSGAGPAPVSERQRILIRGHNYGSEGQLMEECNREILVLSQRHNVPFEAPTVMGGGVMEWRRDRDRHLHLHSGFVMDRALPLTGMGLGGGPGLGAGMGLAANAGRPASAMDLLNLAAALARQSFPPTYKITVLT